jgi:uncharacterized protein (TIGR02246 family)
MNRSHLVIAFCLVGVLTMAGANTLAMNGSDERNIRAVVTAYVEAWNHHEMETLAGLFTDDADWINIVGMHWRGRAAIVKAHDVFHRTIFQKMEIGVTDIGIRTITSDVAAAVIALQAGEYTAPNGRHQNATLDRLSLILVNRDGKWRIAHGHNTVVDPSAAPFDPVNSDWNGEGRR